MLNDLEALEVFASLCTTGSIQKTAQALGIDSPTASQRQGLRIVGLPRG